MKFCPKCNMQLDDMAAFCPNCGTQFIPNMTAPQPQWAPVNLTDHTAEFDPADISANKVFAMLPYLFGLLGIVVALLASGESKYAGFHTRQALKIEISQFLVGIIGVLLAFTLLVPIAAAVCTLILTVVRIICFFRVCAGKAIEAPIVNSLSFLK